MELKPSEFWVLTPVEFSLLVEARSEKDNQNWDVFHQFLAWHASNVMNASGNLKKQITPEKLLSKKKTKRTDKNQTTEQDRKKYDDMKKDLLERLKTRG